MVVETKKILDPKIKVHATCVRVPVFVGHAESVNLEFTQEISEDEAREALRAAPGITVLDDRGDGGYVTPKESAGEDDVYVSRIRQDPTIDNGISMWVVSGQPAQRCRTEHGTNRRNADRSVYGESRRIVRSFLIKTKALPWDSGFGIFGQRFFLCFLVDGQRRDACMNIAYQRDHIEFCKRVFRRMNARALHNGRCAGQALIRRMSSGVKTAKRGTQ